MNGDYILAYTDAEDIIIDEQKLDEDEDQAIAKKL